MSLQEVRCKSVLVSKVSEFLIFDVFQQFDAAAEKVKNLTVAPSIDDFLALYSLYKQATVGDVNIGE